MSESSGAQGASTLVLRISVPAGAEYQAIVKELAAKVAAFLGDTDPGGQATAAALEQVIKKVASTNSDGSRGSGDSSGPESQDVVFEFRQTADALLIRARGAGRSADARRPLPS
jgi:hypothetical protein